MLEFDWLSVLEVEDSGPIIKLDVWCIASNQANFRSEVSNSNDLRATPHSGKNLK